MQLGADAADVFLLNPALQTLDTPLAAGFNRARSRANPCVRAKDIRPRRLWSARSSTGEPPVHLRRLAHRTARRRRFRHVLCGTAVVQGSTQGRAGNFSARATPADAEWLEFLGTLAGQTAIALENAALFTSLQRSNVELGLAYDSTIEGWSRALDFARRDRRAHPARGGNDRAPGAGIGRQRRRPGQHSTRRVAARHRQDGDFRSHLAEERRASSAEMETIRKHPQYAYELMSSIEYLRGAVDIPYCHHEKWDGTGYPRGWKGKRFRSPRGSLR